MFVLRATTAASLLMAGIIPAAARGPVCGASCATWVFPLVAAAGAACLFLAGAHYLAVAFVPRLSLWDDARRGRARNAAIGAALATAGAGIFAIIVSMYIRL